jgi:hypothetical protein
MKRCVLVLAVLATACSAKRERSGYATIKIDSSFVVGYEVDRLKRTEPPKDYLISDHDEIFEIAKKDIQFYEYKVLEVSDTVLAKILVTGMSKNFVADGKLKVIFLVTFNAKGEQIDWIRLGKLEELSDSNEFETSLLANDTVSKKSRYSWLDMDSTARIITMNKHIFEGYVVDKTGKFRKIVKTR